LHLVRELGRGLLDITPIKLLDESQAGVNAAAKKGGFMDVNVGMERGAK
jgi:hypothetical protein